jgi:uncharacterized protein
LLVALAAITGVATATAAAAPLPPLVEPASQEHHVGKVVFVELVTPDLSAAERFYAGMFGWTFHDLQSGSTHYAAASLEGRPVAGLVQRDAPAGAHRQPAWLTFLAVRDADAARATAVRNGAKVLLEPRSVPDRGREAVFADPQGAVFAVLASTSGDPPDELAEPGEWIWSSLFARDPDADAGFYQALLDYEVFDLPSDGSDRHLMLASGDYARASANMLPAAATGAHPHWLNYVRVEDASRMADKAVALGGRVLVGPRLDRHGGHIAIVADPQGAPFGLLEWSATDTKETTK